LIEINLLPSGGKPRATRIRAGGLSAPRLPGLKSDPWTTGVGVALLVVVLAVGLTYWQTEGRKTELNAGIATAVEDSVRLANTIELLESLRARQDTLAQRIVVIRDIDTRRYVWPHILDEVSRAVPAFTWLARVNSVESPDTTVAGGPLMTIEGNAGSTQALTRFMKNLESSPFIRDVTLVTSEQVIEEGRTFQRFTLEARYEAADDSMIETVPLVQAPPAAGAE
jgi:Tfp pilus assembly protein PilN